MIQPGLHAIVVRYSTKSTPSTSYNGTVACWEVGLSFWAEDYCYCQYSGCLAGCARIPEFYVPGTDCS